MIAIALGVAGGLMSLIVMVSIVALIAATVAAPFLKVVQVGHWFAHLFGGGGADARAQLIKYANEIDAGNGSSVHDDLLMQLDCTTLPRDQRDNYCIMPALSEDNSPIPQDKLWLVPIWQAAAQKYKIPWELLAAVNAARSNFGETDCDLTYSSQNVGQGIGFYRAPRVGWAEYGDAGKPAGHATDSDLAGGCHKSDQPVDMGNDGSSSPFDAVAATYAMAAELADNGAKGLAAWDYNGDSHAITGVPKEFEPYNPYVSADTALFSANVGATPDTVTIFGDIPRNYLILYVSAANRYNYPWEELAAFGKNETNHGRSDLPGVKSGLNSAGCCAGPMQFSLLDTWKQPGWEQYWTGSAGVGYAFDWNKDGKVNVWDPRDAVPAAGLDISNLLKDYNGNFSLALAAYNAGSGNVAKYGGVPPFKETQGYVANGLKWEEAYTQSAARNPQVINRLLLDNQTNQASGSGQDHSGDGSGSGGAASTQDSCKGKLPDDKASKAVAWRGDNLKTSACYVDIVHDWYTAIVDNPPNQGADNRLALAIKIARQELAKNVSEQPMGCNRGPEVDQYLLVVGIDATLPKVNNCFLDEPTDKQFNLDAVHRREWCAAFLSWVLNQAGVAPVTEPNVNGGHGSASVADFVAFAKDKGILRQPGHFLPSPGDLVVFQNGTQLDSHIGLIVSRDRQLSFDTIEGNSGGTVAQRTYQLGPTGLAQAQVEAFIDMTNLYGDATSTSPAEIGLAGFPTASGINGSAITPGLAAIEHWVELKGGPNCYPGYDRQGTHATNSYHYKGEALDIDFYNNPQNCLDIWNQLFAHSDMFAELFGPTSLPQGGLYNWGAQFSNFGLQAEHQNHIHVAYTGSAIAIQQAFGVGF